jgi:hypothetical protein
MGRAGEFDVEVFSIACISKDAAANGLEPNTKRTDSNLGTELSSGTMPEPAHTINFRLGRP